MRKQTGVAGLPNQMKNRLYSIALFAILIPFAGPWEGARLPEGLAAGKPSKGILAASDYLPLIDLDLADLDARDANNQPIQSDVAAQQLSDLFLNNLFNLTMVRDLHGMAQIWTDLQLLSALFHDLIIDSVLPWIRALPNVILPSPKRFVHNGDNLWITLFVGTLLLCTTTQTFCSSRAHQKLNLRC
jgi:hypothetical protein